MSSKRQPEIVVIGGGTGMPVLLRGLKDLPVQLTALVTVADDGGSTGKIRSEMAIPAPGDIRNVIAALSDAEPMLLDLFQHRFTNGNVSGHSMGNLLLAAMTSISGNFYQGIKEISRVLNVKGRIYPISNESMSLHAEMKDGTIVSGESAIPLANKTIGRVFLQPEPVKPLPNAVHAIKQADLIVISPGSLYTSIIPNLIIPGIDTAIQEANGQVAYVCNVMTQQGETSDFTASDHIKAINHHIGEGCIDSIIVHNEPISESIRNMYAEENAVPVINDIDKLRSMNLQVVEEDIIDRSRITLRHDTDKIAQLLFSMMGSQ